MKRLQLRCKHQTTQTVEQKMRLLVLDRENEKKIIKHTRNIKHVGTYCNVLYCTVKAVTVQHLSNVNDFLIKSKNGNKFFIMLSICFSATKQS